MLQGVWTEWCWVMVKQPWQFYAFLGLCLQVSMLKGNGSSEEINFVWGEGGHLLSWLMSLERTTGVIVTSHSAALLRPALCQQPAEQGELPKVTCQLQIITLLPK